MGVIDDERRAWKVNSGGGPSGGGKDTLSSEAKQRLADEAHIEFAQGVISTPVTAAGEMHVEMGAADVERE